MSHNLQPLSPVATSTSLVMAPAEGAHVIDVTADDSSGKYQREVYRDIDSALHGIEKHKPTHDLLKEMMKALKVTGAHNAKKN